MWKRNALMFVAGAAIFALDASASSAQDTTTRRPTSSQRISIRKEAAGEVVTRVDTVYSYKTDTLRLPGRTDTVVTTHTVVRVDTVKIPIPQILQQIGGFYFGLGAGSSLPSANFNDSDKPGWRIEGLVGVDPVGSPFGGRLTAGYSSYTPHSYASPFTGDAQIWNLALDGKIRFLTISPLEHRVHFYGVGGVTWNRFKDVVEVGSDGVFNIGERRFLPAGTLGVGDNDWHSGWGYNLGGGGQIGWGRTNLFVETRYSAFKGMSTWIAHAPLIVGVTWY
jgi:hypothetical protein